MIMAADATKEIQFEIGHVLFVPSLAAKNRPERVALSPVESRFMAEKHKFSCRLGLVRRFGAPHNLPQPTATASPSAHSCVYSGSIRCSLSFIKTAFLLIGE